MLELTQEEKAILNSELATTGDKIALSIVVKAAEMLGAKRLVKLLQAILMAAFITVTPAFYSAKI